MYWKIELNSSATLIFGLSVYCCFRHIMIRVGYYTVNLTFPGDTPSSTSIKFLLYVVCDKANSRMNMYALDQSPVGKRFYHILVISDKRYFIGLFNTKP